MHFPLLTLAIMLVAGALGFSLGHRRAPRRTGGQRPPALPHVYGLLAACCAALPALAVVALWAAFGQAAAKPWLWPAAAALLSAAGLHFGLGQVRAGVHARRILERGASGILAAAAGVSILITLAIVGSVLFEAVQFFQVVPPGEFLFGLQWSPQIALRADQAGASGAFGAVPVFLGTLLITAIALLIAIPVGLFCAVYMAEYAGARMRSIAKPMLEILAGIPTVVYGYFAIVTLSPLLRALGEAAGVPIASESALAAGIVMGIMIIPMMSSLSDDVIRAVPNALREASFGLGATHSETVTQVVLPAAVPGLMGAALLSLSRAIGETMIVVMAAGLAANLTINPLEAVTTVTAQIVTLLVGDQEFDSPKTLAAFALGLALFVMTLLLNVVALVVVKRFKRRYA